MRVGSLRWILIIDPDTIEDWDSYYNSVYTQDDLMEYYEECVTDAREFLTVFSNRFNE